MDLPQFEQVPVINFGASDVKDCFHQAMLPEHSGFREYFSRQPFLPGILALLMLEASLSDLIPKFPIFAEFAHGLGLVNVLFARW